QPNCNDSTWPIIAPNYCSGIHQSPINIVSASAQPNATLTPFTFQNFNNTSALKTILNSGYTSEGWVVTIGSGVRVSGGGLSEAYDSLQFHLHWGNGSSVPGSEHTVDGKRYAMELHIVNSKSSYNQNTTLAVADSTGIAALGFFIEVRKDACTFFPSEVVFLSSGESTLMAPGISLDDLLVGVNRTKYYRYLGSLTTPMCNEAVVWTVFKDPIQVSKDLVSCSCVQHSKSCKSASQCVTDTISHFQIDLFSTTVHITNSSSPFVTNVYRDIQPAQPVTTQPSSSSSTFTSCYSVLLMALSLVLGRS
uniref:Carbonic anhydrase n=1 Tax=Monopterus albus TaxID=43700 RepID=A0A3Q3R5T4_MONAL